MSITPTPVSARDIRVSFGSRLVLRGVDLDAEAGRVTAVVGPNGSGKTTLLRALAGLIDCEGDVRYGASDLRQMSPVDRARTRAYLPQSSALRALLRVREVVALARYAHRPGWWAKSPEDDAVVERALRRIGVLDLIDQPFPKLSGGQQRLVLLARALASGAPVLLFDEPTASLDVKHGLLSFELLSSLAEEGYTIVIVLHDLDDVLRHAHAALLLADGQVRCAGSPAAPAFSENAEAVYDVQLVPAARLGFRRRTASTPEREP